MTPKSLNVPACGGGCVIKFQRGTAVAGDGSTEIIFCPRHAAVEELIQCVADLSAILDDYVMYAEHMRKIGRGFSTVDTAGRIDVSVLAGARALLAKIGEGS